MNIRQLAVQIRKSHRQTKSWPNTGRQFGISGGMAYRIAKSGYEPADEAIRKKLGLDVKTCSKCGHRHFNRKKIVKPDFIIQWEHLPREERHKVIQEYLKWKSKTKAE